jgi:choline dehydrogenase-like flavoprotein
LSDEKNDLLYNDQGRVNLDAVVLGGVAHEVGSMRMSEDETGVVDADLKVEGFDNLNVCDNSIIPVSPCGNSSLTLVALAKRLAAELAGP